MADTTTTVDELRRLVDAFVSERNWQQFHTPKNLSMALSIEVAELMPRRGLVVIISDLFFPIEDVFSGLDHLLFHGHDLIVFQVLDPLEHGLSVGRQVRFQDLETGEERTTQTDEIRPLYMKALLDWQRELDDGLRGRSVDRVLVTTDQPLEQALFDYLTRRSQLF